MPGVVTPYNLTRIADDGGTWSDLGGGQGGGDSTDLYIAGSQAHGRKVGNEQKGFNFDNGAGINLNGGSDHVGMWVNVTTYSNINIVELIIGVNADLDTGNRKSWNVLTGATYPAAGGWVKVFAHVNATSDGSHASGSPDLTAIRGFGAWFHHTAAAGNIYNCWIDSIEYTSGSGGLLIDGGSGGAPATFADFNDDATNGESVQRWGILNLIGGVNYVNARLVIADATATVFNDSGFVIVFADQPYVEADFMGITIDLQNASTDIDWSGGVIQSAATTRQGDVVVTGTAGAFDATGMTFAGLRAMVLTSACAIASSSFNKCGAITVGGGSLTDCVITEPTAPIEVSDLNELTNCTLTSDGTGYLIDLGTVDVSGGDVTMSWNNSDDAYGANQTANATIVVNVTGGGTNKLVISVADGYTAPTVNNTGSGGTGDIEIAAGNKTKIVTGLPSGTEARVLQGSFTLHYEDNITDGDFVFTYTPDGDKPAVIRMTLAGYIIEPIEITLDSENQTIPATVRPDPGYV